MLERERGRDQPQPRCSLQKKKPTGNPVIESHFHLSWEDTNRCGHLGVHSTGVPRDIVLHRSLASVHLFLGYHFHSGIRKNNHDARTYRPLLPMYGSGHPSVAAGLAWVSALMHSVVVADCARCRDHRSLSWRGLSR